MLRKAIGATFILLLMTRVISAQENTGSAPFRPGVHLKNDAPSRVPKNKRNMTNPLIVSTNRNSKRFLTQERKTLGRISVQLHHPATKNKQ
jgi:hypothetical protein